MDYEQLLEEARKNNIKVKEIYLKSSKGRIEGNRIAISKDIPTMKEKACILAEELAHYYLNVGNILDQSKAENRRQEQRARFRVYDNAVGLMGIVRAYEHRCHNLYEMAEYLDVSEEFLEEALKAYKSKYGTYAVIDAYAVYFEPSLSVMKLF